MLGPNLCIRNVQSTPLGVRSRMAHRNEIADIYVICKVGVIKIVNVINCNLITFSKLIENNCNSVFTLITIIEM